VTCRKRTSLSVLFPVIGFVACDLFRTRRTNRFIPLRFVLLVFSTIPSCGCLDIAEAASASEQINKQQSMPRCEVPKAGVSFCTFPSRFAFAACSLLRTRKTKGNPAPSTLLFLSVTPSSSHSSKKRVRAVFVSVRGSADRSVHSSAATIPRCCCAWIAEVASGFVRANRKLRSRPTREVPKAGSPLSVLFPAGPASWLVICCVRVDAQYGRAIHPPRYSSPLRFLPLLHKRSPAAVAWMAGAVSAPEQIISSKAGPDV